jgi:hypothetical protein
MELCEPIVVPSLSPSPILSLIIIMREMGPGKRHLKADGSKMGLWPPCFQKKRQKRNTGTSPLSFNFKNLGTFLVNHHIRYNVLISGAYLELGYSGGPLEGGSTWALILHAIFSGFPGLHNAPRDGSEQK